MQAVISTGGKQYTVSAGDIIYLEKIDSAAGESVKFDRVLAIVDGVNTVVGSPVVAGAYVTGNIVKHGKQKKIIVYKYNAKKNYRRKQGHRQPYTKVQIGDIVNG